MQKLPKSFTAITQPHMIRFISTVFGRDTLCGCVCDSVRGSVGPSGKMIRFTSNKDQNVPRRSLYRPTFTPRSRTKYRSRFQPWLRCQISHDGPFIALSHFGYCKVKAQCQRITRKLLKPFSAITSPHDPSYLNLKVIFLALPILPSHVSPQRLRITFLLHMALCKFFIYCIVLYCTSNTDHTDPTPGCTRACCVLHCRISCYKISGGG